MIANIFKRNEIRILSFLLISPGSKYRRNEIKEKTKMNNVALDNTLQSLVSLRLIEERKHIYGLNLQTEENKTLFEIITKEYKTFSIPYKIFNILIDISGKLSKIREINSAILFGSYSKIIFTDKSDIDIAVIFSNKIKESQRKEKIIIKEINKISKKEGKIIQLHFFSDNDMKRGRQDPLIKDILRNGKYLF